MPVVALLLPLLIAAPMTTPRERIRFDAGWRFLRGAEPKQVGGKGPFAWEFRPVAARELGGAAPEESTGFVPAKLGESPLQGAGVFGLFRTDLGSGRGERFLRLESVDDNAAVWLNGTLLGVQRGYGQAREFALGETWNPAGPNRLLVLVENTGGAGGINGAVTLDDPLVQRPVPEEAKPNFRDAAWRNVHLPHDYVVEGTFSPEEEVGHGFLPKPTAWYRKTFTVDAAKKGKAAWIEFDGVYRNAEVYLNGERLGREPSGYIGFRFDVRKKLRYGAANTLAVYVDPSRDEGWWYEGGGIYRHVWLEFAGPVHVVPDSLYVRSGPYFGEPGENPANVRVEYDLVNDGPAVKGLKVFHRVVAPNGRVVATLDNEGDLAAGETVAANAEGGFGGAKLWTPETPAMYRLETRVMRGREVLDAVTTPFGVRRVAWDKDRGFLLNDKPVKLKGTCNHQDHAGLGTALPDRMWEWRIRRLKAMGSNAYRCAHNPPAKELLDACDRLGMLVLDETRHLGDATTPKSPRGTAFDSLSEWRRMIVRDRNHPSVFAWSAYNEEPLQATEEGARIFAAMAAVARELDEDRPSVFDEPGVAESRRRPYVADGKDPRRVVTGGDNGGYDGGIVRTAPVFGFNYNIWAYDRVRDARPDAALFGSETGSTVSTRGEYANDPVRGYVSAYDRNHPAWANTAEAAWRPIAQNAWMAGAFVWTGFDYRGEPTPYVWPNVSSHFGILDMCGFPKDNFYYYQAQWGDRPVVHLLPHWNWAGREGQPIEVWAHTNAPRVELFLNGRSLGTKDVPQYGHAEWSVLYAPGRLEACGVFAGGKVVRDVVETAGPPVALRLRTEVRELMADDEDVAPVDVLVVDAKGRVVPTADNAVAFEVVGAGEVRGVGNGDPSSHERDKGTSRRAFHGLCAVYVGAKGRTGTVELRATSPGLKPATLRLRSKAVSFPRG